MKNKYLLLFIASGICISGLELYLRMQHARYHNFLTMKYQDCTLEFTASPNPKLIYFSTNRHDQDSSRSRKKEEGEYRIVVIGDSVATGQGVEFESAFGKVLERKLNLNSSKKKFDVVILGCPGYSTSQELVVLNEEAFEYAPDLIIWSYCLNDPAHPVYHDANGELGRYFFKPKLHLAHFLAKKLFFLNEKIKSRHCPREFHAFLHCVYWDQVVADIQQIGRVSQNRKVPIIFLIHPIFEKNKKFDEYSLLSLHQQLRAVASTNGLVVLDLLECFKHFDPEELRQHSSNGFDPWHPNERGHALIADCIFEMLGHDHSLNLIH